jgi:hypothetical protein
LRASASSALRAAWLAPPGGCSVISSTVPNAFGGPGTETPSAPATQVKDFRPDTGRRRPLPLVLRADDNRPDGKVHTWETVAARLVCSAAATRQSTGVR